MRLLGGVKLLVTSGVIVAVWVTGAIIGANVVSATGDTTIQTVLSGNQEPILTIDNVPQHSVVISAVPFRLHGSINALSQLRIYIDGAFSQVVPLSVHDTSFDYDITVSPGTHTVTIVGVSAYGSSNPEINFTITYTPEPTPSQPPFGSPRSGQANQQGGVILTNQIQSGMSTVQTPLNPMLDALYNGLIALNIVTPRDLTQTPTMLWRLMGVTTGLVLVFMPWVFRWIYRRIWYGWLGRDSSLNVRYSSLIMRILGGVLLMLIIMFS